MIDERIDIDGYSVLSSKGLIVFKAKAWLDMKERSKQGERGLSKKIKKHLNDIARLTGLLNEADRLSLMGTSNKVVSDMKAFISQLELERASIPQNEDIMFSQDEIFELLQTFLLE